MGRKGRYLSHSRRACPPPSFCFVPPKRASGQETGGQRRIAYKKTLLIILGKLEDSAVPLKSNPSREVVGKFFVK